MKRNPSIVPTRYLRQFFLLLLSLFSLSIYAVTPTVIPDVKLKSKKTPAQQSPTYLATTPFSKEAIINSPVVTLSELFKQEQSAVRLTNNSADVSQTALSLRGFGDNAVANSLILVDGFPLTNPSLLAPNFNSIPLSDIERIEIFQGSEGSLWGDQAVGGVVNIITKHPKKFFANSIFSGGSYHTYYDTILVGDKLANGLFYKVFGLVGKTNHYRDHNQQQSNNAALQLGWDYARGTLSLNLQTYGDITYFPGGLSEEQFLQNPRQASEFKNYSRYRTQLFQLLSKHQFNNEWLFETRLAHHATDGTGWVRIHFDRNDRLSSVNPRLIGVINKNKVILGYDGQLSYYELLNSKVQTRASATQNNIYSQVTLALTDQLDLILGARKAWQRNRIEELLGRPVNSLDQVWVTEQGVSYQLNPALSFFVRRDGNISFPKANEETWVPEKQTSLQVQTGTSYEAGSTWQTESYRAQFSVYRLDLHDEIAFDPTQTSERPFGSFANLDQTRRYGLSLSQRYEVNAKTSLNGQLNYVNARFASGLFNGKWIPAVPAINANVGVNYAWNEHWKTQYTVLYTDSRYASGDAANVSKQIAGYWLHDVALQYFWHTMIVSVEAHNIWNKRYTGYAAYDSFTQKNSYYPAAGRNYLLTLKVNID